MSLDQQILVIDDDENIRDCLSLWLSDEGYEVLTASNGAVALEMINRASPRLILLDMRMPVMDGWAFAQAYRQTPGKHVPIIVLTAAVDASVYAAQVKADNFLPKPFDLNKLLTMVSHYLAA